MSCRRFGVANTQERIFRSSSPAYGADNNLRLLALRLHAFFTFEFLVFVHSAYTASCTVFVAPPRIGTSYLLRSNLFCISIRFALPCVGKGIRGIQPGSLSPESNAFSTCCNNSAVDCSSFSRLISRRFSTYL